MDCKVLMEGYKVFKEWMLEWTELYVDYYITIQSLASTYMLKSGCYDNVYQLSGILQHYIPRCVVGGRVMSAKNKQYHVKKKLADFDACTLYPSAMYVVLGCLKDYQKYYKITGWRCLKDVHQTFII